MNHLRCLIENDDTTVFDERPGETQQRPLADAQIRTFTIDYGVQVEPIDRRRCTGMEGLQLMQTTLFAFRKFLDGFLNIFVQNVYLL